MISGQLCGKEVRKVPLASVRCAAGPCALIAWERSTGVETLQRAPHHVAPVAGGLAASSGNGGWGSVEAPPRPVVLRGTSPKFGVASEPRFNGTVVAGQRIPLGGSVAPPEETRRRYHFANLCAVRSSVGPAASPAGAAGGSDASAADNTSCPKRTLKQIDDLLASLESGLEGSRATGYDFSTERAALRSARLFKQRRAAAEARAQERMIEWNEMDVRDGVPGAQRMAPDQRQKIRSRARQMEMELREMERG